MVRFGYGLLGCEVLLGGVLSESMSTTSFLPSTVMDGGGVVDFVIGVAASFIVVGGLFLELLFGELVRLDGGVDFFARRFGLTSCHASFSRSLDAVDWEDS